LLIKNIYNQRSNLFNLDIHWFVLREKAIDPLICIGNYHVISKRNYSFERQTILLYPGNFNTKYLTSGLNLVKLTYYAHLKKRALIIKLLVSWCTRSKRSCRTRFRSKTKLSRSWSRRFQPVLRSWNIITLARELLTFLVPLLTLFPFPEQIVS